MYNEQTSGVPNNIRAERESETFNRLSNIHKAIAELGLRLSAVLSELPEDEDGPRVGGNTPLLSDLVSIEAQLQKLLRRINL